MCRLFPFPLCHLHLRKARLCFCLGRRHPGCVLAVGLEVVSLEAVPAEPNGPLRVELALDLPAAAPTCYHRLILHPAGFRPLLPLPARLLALVSIELVRDLSDKGVALMAG